MILKKINIQNYKSIENVDIQVNKLHDSYTTIFVGLNETGKSNILDAISYFQPPTTSLKFDNIKNFNSSGEYIDLYFDLAFETDEIAQNLIEDVVEFSEKAKHLLPLFVPQVSKNVFMKEGEDKFKFIYVYKVNFEDIVQENCYYLSSPAQSSTSGTICGIKYFDELKEGEDKIYSPVTKEFISDLLKKVFEKYLQDNDLNVSVWKAEDKYLITKSINLTEFSSNIDTCIPLKNIFYISGYDSTEAIKKVISELSHNPRNRTFLEQKLSKNISEYLHKVWKEHPVDIAVRIEKDLVLDVSVKDKNDEFNLYNINERSQGFRQFISLILSISIANEKKKLKNAIIIVDEPENHLHPSGIRYMRDELLKIGKNNYVFLATHSNFMIDRKEMSRHYIVQKGTHTNLKRIEQEQDLSDDEVLNDAFGLNILNDFLSPHKILVEGLSDKKILMKALNQIDSSFCFNISNGTGDNIVARASLINMLEIPVFVVLDDDEAGKKNKKLIVNQQGIFSKNNVKTIRDLVPDLMEEASIEDTLDTDYVIAQTNTILEKYGVNFAYEDKAMPIIKSIKAFLYQNGIKDKNEVGKCLEQIKSQIAENYDAKKIKEKSPYLFELAEAIIGKA